MPRASIEFDAFVIAHLQEAVCASRIDPMSAPPSPPDAARVTRPNGAFGTVPDVFDHKARQVATSFGIMQA